MLPMSLMTLLLACTFVFYGMSLRRRRAWSMEKRREELRRNYEKALDERSPNEIFMFDADTLQITYANDYALDNLGYTLEQLQQEGHAFPASGNGHRIIRCDDRTAAPRRAGGDQISDSPGTRGMAAPIPWRSTCN